MVKTLGTVAEPKEIRDASSPPPERSCSHENRVAWHGACPLFLSRLTPLAAQTCPTSIGDDGFQFTGSCCATAVPNLPDFPELKMDATYACIKDCSTVTPFSVQVRIGVPVPDPNGACDQFQATLSVAPGVLPLYYHQDLFGNIACTPSPAFFSVPGLSTATPSGFVQMFIGQWNLPAGQWPENRKIWSTVGIVTFDETGVCTPTPMQPSDHFTIGATTAYDSGGATISLFNGGVNVFRVMNDHANTVRVDPVFGTEAQFVGTNLLSALVFQISF